MKICKQCNLIYNDDVNYCPTCGQLVEKVEEKKTCSKCGFALEDYMAFCPQCGTSANFNEHENSVPSDKNHDVRKEKTNSDNSSETVDSSDGLVTKGQIVYTLICIAIALISFLGMRPRATFSSKFICALVAGMVVLYVLAAWNYIRKQYLSNNSKKTIVACIGGVVGFILVSVVYWTVLSSYNLCAGIPARMSLISGVTMMIGTTIGGVGVIVAESAIVFFTFKFILTLFRKN